MPRIDWEGVLEVRADSKQVLLRYRAGDASWIATRPFLDPEHADRFLEVARRCLARPHAVIPMRDPVRPPFAWTIG